MRRVHFWKGNALTTKSERTIFQNTETPFRPNRSTMNILVYIIENGFLITNQPVDERLFGSQWTTFGPYPTSQEAYDSVKNVADVIYWNVRPL